MTNWWVFHEDKVEEAIEAWKREREPDKHTDDYRDPDVIKSFLYSDAVKRLGMRKE